ncbi:alpha/beta fold hydrolase [Cognatishimia activa]|uniref:Haloacetate dehalogenase H-1 n=1 Tax=Cognatishimia activa TaxID=1715691 RepID=A0A0P1ISL2_9RHOB|nr:alpha/beta hydrolase [Cognatishimia activa]CUI70107.1 Haloacetate dehalogenase H-1 [Cognatishimia activa]CUK26556.1 Haloacetate dehalogenase H-1 [Cognatishimia activa]
MPNFETTDGLTLYFSDQGEGLPVLCLSGLSRNSNDFSYIDGHLDGVRLIKMDYRGRGRSDWDKDYASYNIPRESMDALELMDHLGIVQFALLGSSRGGLCAMAIGAMAKHRLLGVAFNDIGPEIDPRGLAVINDYLGRPPVWKTLKEASKKRPKVMVGFDNVPASRWREEIEHLYRQTDKGLGLTYDPKLRDAVLEAGVQQVPDLWPFYEVFSDIPVAVLRGEHSNILAPDCFEKMGATLPHAITVEVKDRGHIPFLDEPECVDALRQWVDQIKA